LITPNEFRSGVLIRYNGEVFQVLSYSRSRTAQRRARVVAKIRNIKTGSTVEESFESELKLEDVQMEKRKGQYLYADDLGCHFMDMGTYDQFVIPRDAMGDAVYYLTDGCEVDVEYLEDRPIGIEAPMFVVLPVAETEPNFRGDTATGGGKPARLSTGLVVDVPFFVKNGDKVKVDTRTNTYVERA